VPQPCPVFQPLLMGKSKAAKVQVPECRYGAACTRRDCIFKHPPKKQAAPVQEKTDKVCFAYVAGRCAFGRLCHDKHPDEASCRTIRDRYAKIDCQWGRNCRTEGCLYQHPSDEPAGPAMPLEPAKPQPAVFAAGPRIVPQQAPAEEPRFKVAHSAPAPMPVPVPKAVSQAVDLRDVSAFDIADPLERFLAVNAHNTGTQSAALLDLHFQSTQTFQSVLDDVLPERLAMFPDDGVWIMTGAGGSAPSRPQRRSDCQGLYEAVQEYLVRHRYDFTVGQAGDGHQGGFLVRGRKRLQDPLEGVRALLLCGIPGSGKSMVAEALVRKSKGRFIRVCQDDVNGSRAACEEAFRAALVTASQAAGDSCERVQAGSWWWDHAFNPERFYLAVCFRAPVLAFLHERCRASLPRSDFLHATVAYQPTGLDLRRHLGRPFRVTFRCHLVLEGTSAPHHGEHFEALLCTARTLDGDKVRQVPVHIMLAGPRSAARQMQVLNAVPLDKRILANSTVGSFKVRSVTDLTSSKERLGMCLLMYKAGEHRDTPAPVSFDAACVFDGDGAASTGATAAQGPGRAAARGGWTELGEAALASLDPVVVLEETRGASEHEWSKALTGRCAQLGFKSPQIQVSRPMGPGESKLAQWTRLRPSCLLHCAAEPQDAAQLLREGAAVLRRGGAAELPPRPQADALVLHPIVVLDRCNLERLDRKQWVQLGGLQKSEVIALHLDVPEVECINRVARRGEHHPMLKATTAAEAVAAVRPLAKLLEPPAECEGFRAIVRLKGASAAAHELVRRWTQDFPVEMERGKTQPADGEDEDPEAPAPPMPHLKEWIEVEEQGGRRSVWGVPLGCPVDAPLGAPLEGLLEAEPAMGAGDLRLPDAPAGLSRAGEAPGGPEIRWPSMEPEAPDRAHEEDAEERARQEQLAATLRCMGFDEEPALHAALRAGGNLNVAVESVLQGRGTTG